MYTIWCSESVFGNTYQMTQNVVPGRWVAKKLGENGHINDVVGNCKYNQIPKKLN